MMAETTLERPSPVHNGCNSGLYLANAYRTPVKFSSVNAHVKFFCYIIDTHSRICVLFHSKIFGSLQFLDTYNSLGLF